MTLHVFIADKFTKPFCHYIAGDLKLENQCFLYLSDTMTDRSFPKTVSAFNSRSANTF
jgi:hypothetical protein